MWEEQDWGQNMTCQDMTVIQNIGVRRGGPEERSRVPGTRDRAAPLLLSLDTIGQVRIAARIPRCAPAHMLIRKSYSAVSHGIRTAFSFLLDLLDKTRRQSLSGIAC